MFEPTSRYYNIQNGSYTLPDGRVVPYKRRRFPPRGEELTTLVEVTVAQGDRLDLVADRTLADAQQSWRLCDANEAMSPLELEETGEVLRVPAPQPG